MMNIKDKYFVFLYTALLAILIALSFHDILTLHKTNKLLLISTSLLLLPLIIQINLSPSFLLSIAVFASTIRIFPGYRIIITLAAFFLTFMGVLTRKYSLRDPNKLYIVFLIYAIYISLNTIYIGNALSDTRTMGALKTFWKTFIWAYIFLFTITNIKQLKQILWVFTIASIINALFGIFSFITHIGLRGGTVVGLVAQHVNYGNLCLLPIPFLYFHFQKQTNTKMKIFLIILLVIELTGVLISYSRTSYISLTVFVLLILFKQQSNKKQLLIIFTIIALIAITFMPQSFWDRLDTLIHLKDTYANMYKAKEISEVVRIQAIPAAWKIFLQNPLFGAGGGHFNYIWGNYSPIYYNLYMAPHNEYMKMLSEYGATGLFLFLLLLFTYIKISLYLYKVFSPETEEYFILKTINYMWIIILVIELMHNDLILGDQSYLPVLFMISLYNIASLNKHHSN